MIKLEPMKCRDCGAEILPTPTEVPLRAPATSFAQCYYICTTPGCDVAYSNGIGADGRTKIFKDPLRNIPEIVRAEVLDVLGSALNIYNRPTKLAKFGFETSEDALTWTFFRYVLDKGLLNRLFNLPSLGTTKESVFWGSPWPSSSTTVIVPALTRILDGLGEDPQSYSEPDFIADDGKQLLFVEVKYRAANDTKPADYVHLPRYLSDANRWFCISEAEVRAAGFYELVRNWIVGNLLARQLDRTFLLINLATGRCQASSAEFEKSLREPERFQFLEWDFVIARLPKDTDQWLVNYLDGKRLTRRKRALKSG